MKVPMNYFTVCLLLSGLFWYPLCGLSETYDLSELSLEPITVDPALSSLENLTGNTPAAVVGADSSYQAGGRIAELEEMLQIRDRQIVELKQALQEVTSEFGTRITVMRARRGEEDSDTVAKLQAQLAQVEGALEDLRGLRDHSVEEDRVLREVQRSLHARVAELQDTVLMLGRERDALLGRTSELEQLLQGRTSELEQALQERTSAWEQSLQQVKAAKATALEEQATAGSEALKRQEAALVARSRASESAMETTHRAQMISLQTAFDKNKAETAKEREEHAKLRSEVLRLEAALDVARAENERERFLLAYNSGSLFLAAGRYDRAEAEFLKALAIREKDAPLHYNLGVLYEEHLRNRGKARRHYERFLELAPHDRDAPMVMQWLRELQ